MAEKRTSDRTEIIIAENLFETLKEQLEPRYSFQKLLLLHFDDGENLTQFMKTTKCNILTKYPTKPDDFETISCIVINGVEDIDRVKKDSKLYHLPYIIALRKISITTDYLPYYFEDNTFQPTSPASVILLDKQALSANQNEFFLNALFELCAYQFVCLEHFFSNVFFGQIQSREYENLYEKIFEYLYLLRSNENGKWEQALCIYSEFLAIAITLQPNALTWCNSLARQYQTVKEPLFCHFLNAQILTALYEKFIQYFKWNYRDTICFETHQNFLQAVGYFGLVQTAQYDERKIKFILQKFKAEFLNEIESSKEIYSSAKTVMLKLDVNAVYEASQCCSNSAGYFICLAADLMPEDSLLKIMLQLGILNYNF